MSLRPNTISRAASSSDTMLMTTLAFKKLGEIRCGFKIKRFKLLHLVWATDVSGHVSSGGGKVCGHCRAHATETNKANVTFRSQRVF